VTRTLRFWAVFGAFAISGVLAQDTLKQRKPPVPQQQEEEPPEEDASLKPREYTFNPLQAEKEMRVGNYYFHKGNYKAAANRFREAGKWDPNLADSWFRLGEAEERLHDKKAAKAAFAKYLEMAPDGKEAAAAKKKISAP